jgi:hypothetical protein
MFFSHAQGKKLRALKILNSFKFARVVEECEEVVATFGGLSCCQVVGRVRLHSGRIVKVSSCQFFQFFST